MTINQGFVPRNIDKRSKQLEVIQTKKLAEYHNFLKNFTSNLHTIKLTHFDLEDLKQQFFVYLFKNCHIITNQHLRPFEIFLKHKDKYVFIYNWPYTESSFTNNIYEYFKYKFSMTHHECQEFFQIQIEKHFKIKDCLICKH